MACCPCCTVKGTIFPLLKLWLRENRKITIMRHNRGGGGHVCLIIAILFQYNFERWWWGGRVHFFSRKAQVGHRELLAPCWVVSSSPHSIASCVFHTSLTHFYYQCILSGIISLSCWPRRQNSVEATKILTAWQLAVSPIQIFVVASMTITSWGLLEGSLEVCCCQYFVTNTQGGVERSRWRALYGSHWVIWYQTNQ